MPAIGYARIPTGDQDTAIRLAVPSAARCARVHGDGAQGVAGEDVERPVPYEAPSAVLTTSGGCGAAGRRS